MQQRSGVRSTYTSYDQLINFGTKDYTYNSNGELTQVLDTALLISGVHSYTYDTFGNLKSVTLPNMDVISYVLDGQQRRVGEKLNGVLTKQYIWRDQLRIAAELNGAGNIQSEFIYSEKANVPEYIKRGSDLYKVITNHLGSVVAVVNASTGLVAQEIKYDEFGNVTNDTNPGFQPFGFAGGLYDPQTKLVHFNARQYDSETGRWISKDPILFNGGDTNLYGYVLNDPMNLVDPTGQYGVCVRVYLSGFWMCIDGADGSVVWRDDPPNTNCIFLCPNEDIRENPPWERPPPGDWEGPRNRNSPNPKPTEPTGQPSNKPPPDPACVA